jgi:hypothetical protein
MAIKNPVPKELRLAHLYLIASMDEARLKSKREALRKELMPLLQAFDPDEDGHYLYEFPAPIYLDDIVYSGLMAQRRVSEYIDDSKAWDVITRHGLADRCIKTVTITEIDYDELYAANQEGIIPDEEIDSILETDETYALVKIKK